MSDLERIKAEAKEVFNVEFDEYLGDLRYSFNDITELGLDEFDKYGLEMDDFFKSNNLNWRCAMGVCGNPEELYSVDVIIYNNDEE